MVCYSFFRIGEVYYIGIIKFSFKGVVDCISKTKQKIKQKKEPHILAKKKNHEDICVKVPPKETTTLVILIVGWKYPTFLSLHSHSLQDRYYCLPSSQSSLTQDSRLWILNDVVLRVSTVLSSSGDFSPSLLLAWTVSLFTPPTPTPTPTPSITTHCFSRYLLHSANATLFFIWVFCFTDNAFNFALSFTLVKSQIQNK